MAIRKIPSAPQPALLDNGLPAGDRDQIAAGTAGRSRTRPPAPPARRPHAGVAYHAQFWLHGFWDGLLDAADTRLGTGHDFPAGTAGPACSQLTRGA